MFKARMYQDCTTYQRTARPGCCAGTSYTGTVLLTRSRIDLHTGAGTPVCCANSAVVAPCSPARISATSTSATRSVVVAGDGGMVAVSHSEPVATGKHLCYDVRINADGLIAPCHRIAVSGLPLSTQAATGSNQQSICSSERAGTWEPAPVARVTHDRNSHRFKELHTRPRGATRRAVHWRSFFLFWR